MSLHNYWRNKQLGTEVLFSEQICLDFLSRHKDLSWRWVGPKNSFYDLCCEQFTISDHGQGVVIINTPFQVTPGEFVKKINQEIGGASAVYLAINRYEFVPVNDLAIDYPDSISDSIDCIVQHLNIPFTRVPVDAEVDGAHFVGVHGLDIFTHD